MKHTLSLKEEVHELKELVMKFEMLRYLNDYEAYWPRMFSSDSYRLLQPTIIPTMYKTMLNFDLIRRDLVVGGVIKEMRR